jgi:competence protein CoiA
MKFAIVNGQRQEAQPNQSGQCPVCDQAMIAKCGSFKDWHWAHKGRRTCDPWWENETDWHRAWKGQFPDSWQEVVHRADSGEKHIADVKTDQDWVIEFQRSHLNPEERRSRDSFYPKLIWVVDGTRRKRDGAQLHNAYNDGIPVGENSPLRRCDSRDGALLREWSGSQTPVFVDLGEPEVVWWLILKSADGPTYVAPRSRAWFIQSLREGASETGHAFDKLLHDLPKQLAEFESLRAQALTHTTQPRYGLLQRTRRRRF